MQLKPIKQLAAIFIEEVWNQKQYDKLGLYLHSAYVDHSLPASLPPNQVGFQKWIQATSQAFTHQTLIDEQITEGNKTVLKIRMQLTHIGLWRGIEPTGAQVSTTGYRLFYFQEGKILSHWALIDGDHLENQLKQQTNTGCKLPK